MNRTRMHLNPIPWAGWLLLALLAGFPDPAASQPEPETQAKLDSLKRVITGKVFSDADKKDIRGCDRDKTQFLKRLRDAEPGYTRVDSALTRAKLGGADPNSPEVMALLEKKFTFEKGFDDKFTATPRGKKCAEGEGRRRRILEAALKKDREYQSLAKPEEHPPGEPM